MRQKCMTIYSVNMETQGIHMFRNNCPLQRDLHCVFPNNIIYFMRRYATVWSCFHVYRLHVSSAQQYTQHTLLEGVLVYLTSLVPIYRTLVSASVESIT
jgi:hypothetical protein